MNVGVVLLSGPYQAEGCDTAVKFVEAALRKGHAVKGIFLFMDGVYNMNKEVTPTGERHIVEMLNTLGEDVLITACGACGQFRGMKRENSVDNVKVGGLGELVKLLQTCDRIVMFGG